MKKKALVVTLLVAMVASLFVFTGCKKKTDASQDVSYIKDKGTLVVGITDFAPMDYKDDNGNWIGFDADLATAFAEYLGVKAEFVEIDWDSKELELDNKSIDVIWNGMTITDGVKEAMDVSNPYCNNAQVVVCKASVADQYPTADSIKSLKFVVEAGSAGEEVLTDLGLKPTGVQTQAAALMEVQAGTADACVIDLLMAGAMIGEGTSYPELAAAAPLTEEQYGVGLRKGSNLTKKLNKFLKKAWSDGKLIEIGTKYNVVATVIDQSQF